MNTLIMTGTCTSVIKTSSAPGITSSASTIILPPDDWSAPAPTNLMTPLRKSSVGVPEMEDPEGNKTPPLSSDGIGNSKRLISVIDNKKKSPVSALNFDEETKFSQEDEDHYCDSVVQIVSQWAPSPLTGSRSSGKSYTDQPSLKKKKSTSPPQAKPPLRPKAKRLARSKSAPVVPPQDYTQETFDSEDAMLRLAHDCFFNKDYTTALALYKSLFLELDRTLGRSTRTVALLLHKIGETHLFMGNFARSIQYLETAIAIRTELGEDDLTVADSMDRLAVAQLHLNEVESAHDNYHQVLRIKRSRLGIYHEDVAHISTQLGCIYFYCGEVLSAQASFEDALFVYRHLAATNGGSIWTIKTADALCSIGSIKLAQKKYSRAIGFFTEALQSQKQVYGIYHPLVITTLDNLGYAHTKSKNYTVASEIYEEMLHAQVAYHRGYNMDCYESLKKLNVVYEKMDKLYAAIDATLEAISFQKRSLSPDDYVVRKTHSLLARLETKLALTEEQQHPIFVGDS